MLQISINGLHCIDESTSGRRDNVRSRRRKWGSDELAFFVCVLTVDTNGTTIPNEWSYTNEQSFRIRSLTGVDSGEDHDFDYPIVVNVKEGPFSRLAEIHCWGWEIDGASTTQLSAQSVHEALRGQASRTMSPGQAYRPHGLLEAFNSDHFSGNWQLLEHDLLWADQWHVDLLRPLEGGRPAVPIIRPVGPDVPDIPLVDSGPTSHELFEPQSDFRIERRTYDSAKEFSSYRFDVRYTDT